MTGFGRSVALSADRALVAATDAEHPDVVTGGTVYLFERSTGGDGGSDWTQRTRLDPTSGDWYSFGGPLALRGDTAFVGARSTADANEDRTGAVLVFRRDADGWHQRAVLAPPSDESSGYFRRRFAATEDALLIADPRFGSASPRTGSAFVFERTDAGWRRTARFGPDLDAEAPVPVAVAFDGDTALLTSYEHWDVYHSPAGTVHVYERDGDAWSREATLTAPADVSPDVFGFRTALSDDLALVQAPAGDSVIGFERTADGWRHRGRLEAPDWYAAEGFGASLAFDGDRALVGAPTDADSPLDRDWTFVYERDGGDWTRSAALAAPDGDADERFGTAVALADGRALVGAPGDEDRPSRGVAGSAFAFALDRHPT